MASTITNMHNAGQNWSTISIFIQLKTLNEIYPLASCQVVVQTGKENTGGATSVMVEEGNPKKGNGNRNKEDGQGNEKNKTQKAVEKLANNNNSIFTLLNHYL